MSEDNLKVALRFREAARNSGFSKISELAKELGIHENSIRSYWKGKMKPSAKRAKLFSKIFGVSVDWLLYGEDQKPHVLDKNIHKDVVSVPFYDVEASAGYGIISNETLMDSHHYPLSREFITNILRASVQNIIIIKAEGTSMEPTIKSGARLIIDRTKCTRLEGIHVLTMDGNLYVKRLIKAPDRVIVISDNPRYPSIEVKNNLVCWGVPEDPEQMGIIGRVLHAIQSPD